MTEKMDRWITRIKNFSRTIRFKLLLILSIFALIYFITFSFIFFHAIDAMEEKILASYDNMLNLYVSQLKTQISDTDSYLYNLTSNNFDLNMMAIQEPDTDSYLLNMFRVYNDVRLNYSSFSILDSVYIYDMRSGNSLMIPDDSKRYGWIVNNYVEKHAGVEDGWEIFEKNGNLVLARQRMVSDSLSIVAFIQMDKVEQGLKEIAEDIGSEWQIITGEGSVICGSYPENAGGNTDGFFSGYTSLENVIESTDLTFRLLVRKNSVWIQNIWFALFFGTSVCIFLAAFCIVFWGSRKRFLAPLEKLITGMQEFAEGNEDVKVGIGDSVEQELKFTVAIFNNMVLQIKNNRFLIYEEKLEKQKLLIQNLQAQIDPHFFSNTLNMIYNLIATRRNEIAQKCVLLLSSYYRYMTGISQKQVDLEKEFDFINNYLEIMKMRFPNKVSTNIRMADELKHLQIPPMLIQPLVENCMKHGYTDRVQMFTVQVSAYVEKENAVISVEDNGEEFPPKYRGTYDMQRDLPIEENGESSHVGIKNVYQRFLMFYGENARMEIDFKESFARVRLIISCWEKYGKNK